MPADLHVHTTFSDGTDTPLEIAEKASKIGLTAFAITDHDVVDGIPPALEAGKRFGVRVVPGIEFTTEVPDAEIHIIGYFIDIGNAGLKSTLKKIQESRHKRIHKIVEKLNMSGIDIKAREVFELSGGSSPGRPHVARALLKGGVVRSIKDAFNKYLGWKGPAYVPHYKLTPVEAIRLITASGGTPVYAHPAVSNYDRIIPDLISSGLKGIEVYYPGHSKADVKRYLEIVDKHGLIATGGSDYHGKMKEISLGTVTVDDEVVDRLESAGGYSR